MSAYNRATVFTRCIYTCIMFIVRSQSVPSLPIQLCSHDICSLFVPRVSRVSQYNCVHTMHLHLYICSLFVPRVSRVSQYNCVHTMHLHLYMFIVRSQIVPSLPIQLEPATRVGLKCMRGARICSSLGTTREPSGVSYSVSRVWNYKTHSSSCLNVFVV